MPDKVKVFAGLMHLEEWLCEPTAIQKQFIRLTHDKLGHVGAVRLWQGLTRGYTLQIKDWLKDFVTRSQHNVKHARKALIEFTPIPPQIITSVVVDSLCQLPSGMGVPTTQ